MIVPIFTFSQFFLIELALWKNVELPHVAYIFKCEFFFENAYKYSKFGIDFDQLHQKSLKCLGKSPFQTTGKMHLYVLHSLMILFQ